MGTKSNRSSGTQHNQRGVAQGTTLVDPKTGLPVAVVLGPDGKYRLCVDALITANVGNVNVDLDGVGVGGDNVYLVDNLTGNKFKINADGSINSNVEIDAADGDNIAIRDSNGDELAINADGSINSKIEATDLDIRNITHTQDSIRLGDGVDLVEVTPLKDLQTADVPNQIGLDTILNLTTTPIEGKDGLSAMSDRKYIEMQALTTSVKWGYSTNCPFDLFKNQFFALPTGTNCKIYFKASTGTAQVAFAEK